MDYEIMRVCLIPPKNYQGGPLQVKTFWIKNPFVVMKTIDFLHLWWTRTSPISVLKDYKFPNFPQPKTICCKMPTVYIALHYVQGIVFIKVTVDIFYQQPESAMSPTGHFLVHKKIVAVCLESIVAPLEPLSLIKIFHGGSWISLPLTHSQSLRA